jgi:hypothetical protein
MMMFACLLACLLATLVVAGGGGGVFSFPRLQLRSLSLFLCLGLLLHQQEGQLLFFFFESQNHTISRLAITSFLVAVMKVLLFYYSSFPSAPNLATTLPFKPTPKTVRVK